MSLKTFTRLFYIFQFFFDFILLYAVDKLFFLERGLNLSHIAILIACWSGLTILLEVPTGALADKWSRKYVLVLSGLAFSLCYITWFFSSTFWMFLLGFIFRTIGGTFSSGTLESYVYDFLRMKKKEDEFEKVWGRGYALNLTGIAIAISLGGILSDYSYGPVLILSASTPLVVSGVALLLPRINKSSPSGGRSYISFMREGIKRAFSNTILIRVFIYSAIVYGVLGMLDEYDQVLLSSWLGLSNSFIGIWLAISVGISGLSAFFAHKLRYNGFLFLNLIAAVTCILLIVIFLFNSLLVLGMLLFLYIISALMNVLIQGIIQREIASDERATITSVNSLLSEAGQIILGLSFGFITNQLGIQFGYGFFGIITAVYLVGYFVIRAIRKY